jgi:hypothetical protein
MVAAIDRRLYQHGAFNAQARVHGPHVGDGCRGRLVAPARQQPVCLVRVEHVQRAIAGMGWQRLRGLARGALPWEIAAHDRLSSVAA